MKLKTHYKFFSDPKLWNLYIENFLPGWIYKVVRVLTRKRHVNTKNTTIVTGFRRLWDWARSHDYDNLKADSRTVYDQYGPIDTLGSQWDKGKYTATYSNELAYIQYLRVGPFVVSCEDGCSAPYILVELKKWGGN